MVSPTDKIAQVYERHFPTARRGEDQHAIYIEWNGQKEGIASCPGPQKKYFPVPKNILPKLKQDAKSADGTHTLVRADLVLPLFAEIKTLRDSGEHFSEGLSLAVETLLAEIANKK